MDAQVTAALISGGAALTVTVLGIGGAIAAQLFATRTHLRTRWRCKSGSTPSKSMNGTSSLGEKMPIDSLSNGRAPMAERSG